MGYQFYELVLVVGLCFEFIEEWCKGFNGRFVGYIGNKNNNIKIHNKNNVVVNKQCLNNHYLIKWLKKVLYFIIKAHILYLQEFVSC